MSQQNLEFLPIDCDLLSTTDFINKQTGETIKLSHADKLVYSRMVNRFNFFERINKDFFESQQVIAEVTAFSVKSVQRAITTFCNIGIVEVIQNGRSNKYVVHNWRDFLKPVDKKTKNPNKVRQTSFTKTTAPVSPRNTLPKQKVPFVQQSSIEDSFYSGGFIQDYEDDGCPF